MPLDFKRCKLLLDAIDLKTLFIECLGWDRYANTMSVVAQGKDFTLTGVAEKRGFAALICTPDEHGRIPDHSLRMVIDREVTKTSREHIIIYQDATGSEQLWQWVRRGKDQPIKRREFRWRRGQASGLLIERVLPSIAFSLDEEEKLTLPDVTTRATAGFDVEKITKKFFTRFQAEHGAFHGFIKGIKDVAHRDWYASVMLNRLMFCYFIQKKGLLDGDHDYLQNRLARLQQSEGKNKFWSFYQHFLLRLFHEGLSQRPASRKKGLDAIIGRIPYLNGGLFDIHELEREYEDINIPDKAFEQLFAFFDEYSWHLDDRPLQEGNEINPDVLGYIFEKFINQKQMGAYYTKEDITGYISQNTILPFILDYAAKNCAIAFKADSKTSVWRLLADDPDAYIYEPVRRGVIDEKREVIPLPPEIEAGINDVSKRGGWNRPASEPYGLPTETWREHVHRRQRCLELRRKLADGEVTTVNDLITLNLDIRQFMEDVIDRCEGPELLRAIWRCLVGHVPNQSNEEHELGISILDPTCGSGAFLFAALNTLDPLYEACLDRMSAFVDDLERAKAAGEKVDARKFSDFRRTLAEVAEHPNQRYFILKSIIVNNLYGVDIMEEACEICKLRLFLKLVAQVDEGVGGIEKIEPLPDIDFNIRAGNTLVGFASLEEVKKSMEDRLDFGKDVQRIEQQAEAAAAAFRVFRGMQTQKGIEAKQLAGGKRQVRERLKALDDELNRHLASEYGVDSDKPKKFAAWLESHQPFHWFVDFYGIMSRGGFDVIVGNPPYINSSIVRRQYSVNGLATATCPDVYAMVLERSLRLLSEHGNCGMIVPVSVTFSDDFSALRALLFQQCHANWFSTFARIPAALFSADTRVRNTIWIGHRAKSDATPGWTWTTRFHRWFESQRPTLFATLSYAQICPQTWGGVVPKVNTTRLAQALESHILAHREKVQDSLAPRSTKHVLYWKKTAYNWLCCCRQLPPSFDEAGQPTTKTNFGELYFESADARDIAFVALNTKAAFLFWCMMGDDLNVPRWVFADFPLNLAALPADIEAELVDIREPLHQAMEEAVSFKLNAGKKVGNYNLAKCRSVTDGADKALIQAMSICEAAEDFELLYVQMVRTDFDGDSD